MRYRFPRDSTRMVGPDKEGERAGVQITSANCRSERRKYHVPATPMAVVDRTEATRLGHQRAGSPRSSDHRNPSITPTIGLSEYTSRQSAGTAAVAKPTGEMYSPNCTRNGTRYRKSRYVTLSAHSQSPAPNAAPNASTTKNGRARIRQSGRY